MCRHIMLVGLRFRSERMICIKLPNSLMFQKETLNLEAVFGSVFARGSQILSLMKMEYVIPISILGAGLMVSGTYFV